MNITFNIALKGKIHANILPKVIESFKNLNENIPINILCFDYNNDTLPYIKHLNENIINIPRKEWSRAYAFNCQYKYIKSDYYIFHDADFLIIDKNWIKKIKEKLNTYKFIINYTKAFYNKSYTYSVGGSCTIEKNFMLKSGGMDSRMKIWGCEDRDFISKVVKIFNLKSDKELRIDSELQHINHPNIIKKNDPNISIFKKNMNYWNENAKKIKENLNKYLITHNFILEDFPELINAQN